MAWLDSLASDYPSLCRVEDVGTTYEGRTMRLFTIGTGAADNPGIFIDGGTVMVFGKFLCLLAASLCKLEDY